MRLCHDRFLMLYAAVRFGLAPSEGKRASAAMSSSVRNFALRQAFNIIATSGGWVMNGIIYLVGLVVVIGVVLSFLGLR
jgi:hypothetical protein